MYYYFNNKSLFFHNGWTERFSWLSVMFTVSTRGRSDIAQTQTPVSCCVCEKRYSCGSAWCFEGHQSDVIKDSFNLHPIYATGDHIFGIWCRFLTITHLTHYLHANDLCFIALRLIKLRLQALINLTRTFSKGFYKRWKIRISFSAVSRSFT